MSGLHGIEQHGSVLAAAGESFESSPVSGIGRVGANSGGSPSAVAPQDRTELSSVSGVLLQAADGRSVKVTEIQQAIAAGTYNVSASAVADKLIESMMR